MLTNREYQTISDRRAHLIECAASPWGLRESLVALLCEYSERPDRGVVRGKVDEYLKAILPRVK